MKEKMENKNTSIEKQARIINRSEIQEFIEFRKIKPEDFHLIEKLAAFPKDLIIAELHNLFNLSRDNSGKELEVLIKISKDENKKKLYEAALEFYSKYDWATAYNLIRLLEKIEKI
jgi:hypothetical protein